MDADNYTDFIYRYSVVTQMTDYNQQIIKELDTLINNLNNKKQELANKQKDLSKKKSELQSKYGSQFEIIPENVICYSSEGSSFFFSSFYKGEADYGFEFKEGIYRIKLSKSYNNKWKGNSVEWVVHELKEE
jgi:hypothetical protein